MLQAVRCSEVLITCRVLYRASDGSRYGSKAGQPDFSLAGQVVCFHKTEHGPLWHSKTVCTAGQRVVLVCRCVGLQCWPTVCCAPCSGQRVVLHLVNFSKARALYRHGMTPLVRSLARPAWARLPPGACFYHRSPKCKTAYVLSLCFTIDRWGSRVPHCFAQTAVDLSVPPQPHVCTAQHSYFTACALAQYIMMVGGSRRAQLVLNG